MSDNILIIFLDIYSDILCLLCYNMNVTRRQPMTRRRIERYHFKAGYQTNDGHYQAKTAELTYTKDDLFNMLRIMNPILAENWISQIISAGRFQCYITQVDSINQSTTLAKVYAIRKVR